MAIFSNQASLSYNGITINSNIVTGNIIEVLSVTKTAVSDMYSADNDITYIISITNSGSLPLNGLTLTDNLGEYSYGTGTLVPLDYVNGSVVYFINGVLQAEPVPETTSPLVIRGLTVPAGGNAMIIYEASPNEFAPLSTGSAITNTVEITGMGLSPITASEIVYVSEEPVLSITKSLSPVNVPENGELTYTFTIRNSGNAPAVATGNLIITDTFDPILSNITVTVNGAVLPESEYTYDEATGEFATLPGAITLDAATFTRDPATGSIIITPSSAVVTVTGTI